jgi:long-chain acyl-CoA synthetase
MERTHSTQKQTTLNNQALLVAEPTAGYSATVASPFEIKNEAARPKTIYAAFQHGVHLDAQAPALGTRVYVKCQQGVPPGAAATVQSQTVIRRGRYRYLSYADADRASREFGAGLAVAGLPAQSKVGIFAANETQWQLAALGCFSQSLVVVPLYATFGADAIKYISE